MSDQHEEWRPVAGYEGLYSVSNLGRVRSDRSYRKHCVVGQILRSTPDRCGYFMVSLSKKSVHSPKRVHHLVAQAFIGPRPGRFHINHRDGVKANNRLENLEYCSHSDNMKHASENGLYPRGEASHRAKLTAEQVLDIRRRYAAGGITYKALAQEFHVDTTLMYRIVHRKCWKHLP